MTAQFDTKVMRNNDIAVVSMYALKTGAKFIVGKTVGSAALISDAIHSASDLVEYIFISTATRIANKPDVKKYPVGRKALESLIGIAIGIALILAAIQFVLSGITRLAAMVGISDVIDSLSLEALHVLDVSEIAQTVPSFAAIVTMVAAGIASYVVYRFEIRNAIILRSQAVRADAEELKFDMVIEFSVAIGLLIARLLSWGFVDSVAQLVIAFFVSKAGLSLVVENGQKLLGRAILESDQERILSTLRLVEGVVTDVESDDGPRVTAKAYYAGSDTVRVECMLPVNVASSQNIRLITSLAQSRVRRLLEPTYGHSDVFVSFHVCSPDIETDHMVGAIDQYLRSVWGIAARESDIVHALVRYFVTSQFGKALDTISSMSANAVIGVNSDCYELAHISAYIGAYCNFWLNGPSDPETESAFDKVQSLHDERGAGTNPNASLSNALAFYHIEDLASTGNTRHIDLGSVREGLQATYGNKLIDDSLRAEAAHLLARSYYKVSGYQLEKAREWFWKAREIVISATTNYTPLFADRIWTDWGNVESLFLHLDEAERYLELAVDLKQLQGDKHGLAINYGCLASVFARRGHFHKSIELYEEDLRLVAELGVERDKPHVQCKISEIKLKQALATGDQPLIDDALAVALSAREADTSGFYPTKAIVKSYFAQWWLDPRQVDSLRAAEDTLREISKVSDYSANQYFSGIMDRLQGRLVAAKGELDQAKALLSSSSRSFAGIGTSPDLPVQSLISELEALRWSAGSSDAPSWIEDVNRVLTQLKTQVSSTGFVFPPFAAIPSQVEVKRMRRAVGSIPLTSINSHDNLAKLNANLKNLDQIIWFMEI